MNDRATLLFTAEHEWVSVDDGVATFGVTDYAASQLGDVVYVDLPAQGAEIIAGQVCGEIESTKSVSEIYSPVTGRVLEINGDVDADPALVNADPFGRGWLVRAALSGSAPTGLLDRDAYRRLTGESA